MRRLRLFALLLVAPLSACGGGSPTGPDQPTPTPGTPVSGFVFYDENANGVADPAELVRLPGVTVSIGGRTGQTATGGRFTVENVPGGAQSASARPETLPTAFVAGPPLAVSVPAAGELAVPAQLPLGSRAQPNLYLGFGDSITAGDGSSDGQGYRGWLHADLRAYWGKAQVHNGGLSGSKSPVGEERLGRLLADYRPAYLLVLYGTNDYNEPQCRAALPCFTVDALRSMVLQARDFGAVPVVGTIPPVNPLYVDRNAEERNDWVRRMNEHVRAMARQEQVAVAEVYGDFMREPSLSALFEDDKHPNDAGYRVMSRSFFSAITRPYSAAGSSARRRLFGFAPGR